jgi:glutathione-regulated potassium-efflux system ancillary protein KefF
MALLVYAHPYPQRSRANRALLAALQGLESLEVRSLYDLYPDFGIDVTTEQSALLRAELVIWQHPMYWYSVPGLLKHWFDKVLARGWAYGEGGTALRGKTCLWVTTTGGDEQAFSAAGMHEHPVSDFIPPVEQTARFCGMRWLDPLVLHGAHRVSERALAEQAARYRQLLEITIADLEVRS